MKIKEIRSSDLPKIDLPIKECVNSGKWTLYKPATGNAGSKFYLRMGVEVYVLDFQGRVLEVVNRDSSPAMDEVFYFSDLPKPESLSNGGPRRSIFA